MAATAVKANTYPAMLRDECLIRLVKPERQTASKLLYIPDSAQRAAYELYQGVVVACGPGRRRKDGRLNPNEIAVGDHVLYFWGAAKMEPIKHWFDEGEEFQIISEWQVQCAWPGKLSLEEAIHAS